MTGPMSRRCKDDEKLINAVLGIGKRGYIIDTRTQNAAKAWTSKGTTHTLCFHIFYESRIRSGMRVIARTARRPVLLAAVLLRPPSGHRPSRRQTRHALVLKMKLPWRIHHFQSRIFNSFVFKFRFSNFCFQILIFNFLF